MEILDLKRSLFRMFSLRAEWQTFKKNHPAFEKSKKFKSDVGPQLEKFDKGRIEFQALVRSLEKKGNEVFTIGTSVAAALKGYQEVVKELAESDKTITAEFRSHAFDTFADTYVRQYKDVKLKE